MEPETGRKEREKGEGDERGESVREEEKGVRRMDKFVVTFSQKKTFSRKDPNPGVVE